MANYAASVLAKAQTMYNDQFQSAEMREKPSATLMMLLKNRQFLIPDLKALRDREDRATKAYLKNRAVRSLTSSRTHNHSGVTSDSTEVAIAYTIYTDKFATSLKRGDNNVLSDAEILLHEIKNSIINLHEGIETALVTWLDTSKTQASNPPSASIDRATFNATNDAYEILAADADEYWHIIKSIFRQEKYTTSQIDIITQSLLASTGETKSQQGQGNSTNLGFQFSGLDVAESIEVVDANYANGVSYCWPTGLAGILDWIPKQNRAGKGDFDSVLGGYSTFQDPATGLSFALHAFTERADTSGSNGNTQDETTEWELSIDLSPQYAPSTVTDETPIFEIAQI